MTVWEQYSKEEQHEYEEYLRMYGALSAMFNQKSSETGAPYLDSKFQETIYARCFKAGNVDIGNTPHDIKSTFGTKNIGIGLKTWLSSKTSYQKVMQLKQFKTEIESCKDDPEELALKISQIKNMRLKTDYKRLGLKENDNIYHYVTRDNGKMLLSETSYPLIDINQLKPGKLSATSFYFTDGIKNYKYTFSDCEILMQFKADDKNTTLLDTLDVDIMSDPFTFLKSAFIKEKGLYAPAKRKYDYLYLPLYSYHLKKVPKRSGLNAWNSEPKSKNSQTVRPKAEAYIPIPKEVWEKHPYWVDPNVNMANFDAYKLKTGQSSLKINLHMPDGSVMPALFAQSGFKALETKPQSVLGSWILNVLGIKNPQRSSYNKSSTNVVTMDLLKKLGFDSVKLWHEDPNKPREIWIDFANYGSFDQFINDQPVIQNDEAIDD